MKAKLKTSSFHLSYDPELVAKAKELRKTMTPAERKLWHDYLKKLKVRVLRQRPIDHFIVDFYCASAKLVIEVDGEEHAGAEGLAYDLERTRVLEGYGLRVVRFSNNEVLEDFEKVCKEIEALVYPPYPP